MQDKVGLAELQEITLWQMLNKQLRQFYRGADTQQLRQKSQHLQSICFGNSLFALANRSVFGKILPLALFTDYSNYFFVSVHNQRWNTVVRQLLSSEKNFDCFDLEAAMEQTFTRIDEYSEKYNLLNQETISADAGDEDAELYAWTSEYFQLRQEYRLDFARLVDELYEVKSDCISTIISSNTEIHIPEPKDNTGLVLMNIDQDTESIYLRHYCEIAQNIIDAYQIKFDRFISDSRRGPSSLAKFLFATLPPPRFVDILFTKYIINLDELDSKPNLKAFIKHERKILNREFWCLKTYLADLKRRLRGGYIARIQVTTPLPFGFFKKPFPMP